MDRGELERVRKRLQEFTSEIFSGLERVDQQAAGARYVRGLMLDGKRKSMQPMAERLGVDHQQLQQFMTSSTWDFVAVRRKVAARVIEVVGPVAWVIDDTGFAKDGKASPGVARQYSGTLGKVGNCQIAVSLHAVTDQASGVLDWRLYLPQSWDETLVDSGAEGLSDEQRQEREAEAQAVARRRARAKIPDDERHRAKWQQALEMIDEAAGWGHICPLLVSDAGYGQIGAFRQGLSDRQIAYVVATTFNTSAHRPEALPVTKTYAGLGRPPHGRAVYPERAPTLKELALETLAQEQAVRTEVTWRNGTRAGPANPDAAMSGFFLAQRVRPAGRGTTPGPDGVLPERWLLTEWQPLPDGSLAAEPSDYWLSDLPLDTDLETLVRLAKIRWRIEHDYRELKDGLGLDHFEGRSWTGWHRHATLVTAAQLFLTELRLHTTHHDPESTHPKASGQLPLSTPSSANSST
ncbi:transposase [Kineosporia sp. NBRC 101677]|uniref:IS701 family transposase n=1 Tax=Kineosporia sp. NBRC 101677 TaxID=3032197 RepID=UPI00255404C4|nr:transposase [Kineosporia sp. NBRC 101677]